MLALRVQQQRAYRAELTIASALSNFRVGHRLPTRMWKYRFTNTSAGNYTITVTDIDLGLGTTLAGGAYRNAVRNAEERFSGWCDCREDLKSSIRYLDYCHHRYPCRRNAWTVTTGNVGEQTFSSFTIDASSGTGYVDIYVLLDTNDLTSTKTVSRALVLDHR